MENRPINNRQTTGFLATAALSVAMILLAFFAGWQVMGAWNILFLGAFGVAVAFSARRSSPRIALANTRSIPYRTTPQLYAIVDELSRKAGLERPPELRLVPSPVMNAATVEGGNQTTLAVTVGLLERLPQRELIGVLAHEIAHLKNGDIRLLRFAETLVQATVLFVRAGWLMLLFALPFVIAGGGVGLGTIAILFGAPIAARLLQLAIARTREFAADATAAELSGDPLGLASALRVIEHVQRGILHMLLPIPTQSDRHAGSSLFRTHPATEERVERLMQMRSRRGDSSRRPARFATGWR